MQSSISAANKTKKVFILTSSGKPVYANTSTPEDEDELVNIFGLIQATISIVQAAQDSMKSIQTTTHKIVFLLKQNIYLICVSNTLENEYILSQQLDFLYQHILLILTNKIHHILSNNPSTDIRGLLGSDADQMFNSTCTSSLAPMSVSFQSIRTVFMEKHLRDELAFHLRTAVEGSGAAMGLVQRGEEVWLTYRNPALGLSLSTPDLILLSHFLATSPSLRTFDQHWVPLCLPLFNPGGYLQMSISFLPLEGEEKLLLVLVAVSAEAFSLLGKGRLYFERALKERGERGEENMGRRLMQAIPIFRTKADSLRDSFSSLHFLFKFSLLLPRGEREGALSQFLSPSPTLPLSLSAEGMESVWLSYLSLSLRLRTARSSPLPSPPTPYPPLSDSPLPLQSPALSARYLKGGKERGQGQGQGGQEQGTEGGGEGGVLLSPPSVDHSLVFSLLSNGVVVVAFATFDSELFIAFPPQTSVVEACSRAEGASRALRSLLPSLSCQVI